MDIHRMQNQLNDNKHSKVIPTGPQRTVSLIPNDRPLQGHWELSVSFNFFLKCIVSEDIWEEGVCGQHQKEDPSEKLFLHGQMDLKLQLAQCCS